MYFFFFKQKTAYDMRISDWSSDVCSSDLIDASGVAKMTLYHHFKSKNDIIAATLDTRRAQRLDGIQAAMAQARTPPHQILAAFDYLAEIIDDSTFRGCRSEERRVGKECDGTVSSRWSL